MRLGIIGLANVKGMTKLGFICILNIVKVKIRYVLELKRLDGAHNIIGGD